MAKKLIVENNLLINASVSKVWEVLIAPKFIRQWDAIPEDFNDYYLETGREIEWSGTSKLIVTNMIAQEILVQSLFLNKWDISPLECDISIIYRVEAIDGQTAISIEVGDFSQVKDGREYYDSYVEFAERVLVKIKAIAENRV
jgi:hypothetical protein